MTMADNPIREDHDTCIREVERLNTALERLVADLTDWRVWPWTRTASLMDSANATLRFMSDLGLIECRHHPHGNYVYRVNGKLYGRVDGITNESFETLKECNR